MDFRHLGCNGYMRTSTALAERRPARCIDVEAGSGVHSVVTGMKALHSTTFNAETAERAEQNRLSLPALRVLRCSSWPGVSRGTPRPTLRSTGPERALAGQARRPITAS